MYRALAVEVPGDTQDITRRVRRTYPTVANAPSGYLAIIGAISIME